MASKMTDEDRKWAEELAEAFQNSFTISYPYNGTTLLYLQLKATLPDAIERGRTEGTK